MNLKTLNRGDLRVDPACTGHRPPVSTRGRPAVARNVVLHAHVAFRRAALPRTARYELRSDMRWACALYDALSDAVRTNMLEHARQNFYHCPRQGVCSTYSPAWSDDPSGCAAETTRRETRLDRKGEWHPIWSRRLKVIGQSASVMLSKINQLTEETSMKRCNSKLLVLLVIVGLVAVSGSRAAAGKDKDNGTCWKFTSAASTDLYPTDRIKVKDLDKSEAIVGSWSQSAAGCAAGPATDHPVLVPMTGSWLKDFDGNKRLVLDGTLQDKCFNAPFIFECHIDARLDPKTRSSIAGLDGNAYAYCRAVTAGGSDYFPPNNPFTDLVNLTPISCKDSSVLNP